MTPFLIGVCGGSGSGKTLLAEGIVGLFPPGQASLLSIDLYYHSLPDFPKSIAGNYDHPDALDRALILTHLADLKNGNTVTVPVYDFPTHTRIGGRPFHPTQVIVVEGLLLFALEGVFHELDASIFVHACSDVRLIRRIKRDTVTRGRSIESILNQYLETVRPMHARHVEPFRQAATFEVSGEGTPEEVLELARQKLQSVGADALACLA